MSLKLENKIKAVKERRYNFLCKCFSEELSNGGRIKLKELNILEEKKINPLKIFTFCEDYKTVFTKKFNDFYVEELNITDSTCEKILKKLRFKTIEIEGENKNLDIRYNGIFLTSLDSKEWQCVEKLFSEYKKIKKLFLDEKERKKIIEFKKELCQLTDCYKNPDVIKIICEKCGFLLQPETEFCSECGTEIKE